MLKNTLKIPKTDKKTAAIVLPCKSADEIANAILDFWAPGRVRGSETKFILQKLSSLCQQADPSDSEIKNFTNLVSAVLGKTVKSARAWLGYDELPFMNQVGNITNVSSLVLSDPKVWRFLFVSGDFFRLRRTVLAWRNSTSTTEKDDIALSLRAILYPIMHDKTRFKFAAISAVLSRVGDLLDNKIANIYPMLRVSSEEPNKLTLTTEQAAETYQQRKSAGTDVLDLLAVSSKVQEAKLEVSALLDKDNPNSFEWLNVKTMFGDRAEAVRNALLKGKFGFGSPKGDDGCANFINSGPTSGARWLRSIIQQSIQQVVPRVEEITRHFLDSSVIDEEKAEEWFAGIKISKVLMQEYDFLNGAGSFKRDLKEVYKLSGGNIQTLTTIDLLRGRSFASMQTRSISLNPRGGRRTLWHEVGHHFEFSNPNYLALARAFLADRTNGDASAVAPLNQFYDHGNYGSNEIAITDNLSSPYIGKIYGSSNISSASCTEVFSSGFEYLAENRTGAISLVNGDGLIEFVAGVLKEVHA